MAGVDLLCSIQEFQQAEHITLTNAKGAFSESLAEFLVYGILYFTQGKHKDV